MVGVMLLLLVVYCPEDWDYLVRWPAADHWEAAVIRSL